MMTVFMWVGVGLYAAAGFVAFSLNMRLPVTLGLAVLRSALWPLWIFSRGRLLSGERLPMD